VEALAAWLGSGGTGTWQQQAAWSQSFRLSVWVEALGPVSWPGADLEHGGADASDQTSGSA